MSAEYSRYCDRKALENRKRTFCFSRCTGNDRVIKINESEAASEQFTRVKPVQKKVIFKGEREKDKRNERGISGVLPQGYSFIRLIYLKRKRSEHKVLRVLLVFLQERNPNRIKRRRAPRVGLDLQ